MILAETSGGYRFITQPDHAALAGTFVDAWGAGRFERPRPSPAVSIAVHLHDDGWWRTDRYPRLRDDGTPVDFHQLPAETWTELYDEGIEVAVDADPYAGLLVSMHGAGLRRRRYGLSPDWGGTPPAFEAFVDDQEQRQRELVESLHAETADDRVSRADLDLLDALHRTGTPPDSRDTRLWLNYRLLQALDTLSLRICASDASDPETAAELHVGSVPTAVGKDDTSLSLTPVGAHDYRVDPYPFERSPVVALVGARTVPRRQFDDQRDLVDAYYGAERESIQLTLRAVDA